MHARISLSAIQRALRIAIDQNSDDKLLDTCEVLVWKDALKQTQRGATLIVTNTNYYDESGTLVHRPACPPTM